MSIASVFTNKLLKLTSADQWKNALGIVASAASSFTNTLLPLVDAPTWRAALGLAIGTDVQAHDADLDTLAAAGLPISVANGGTSSTNASAARTALGLIIGSNVQAWDADLDTLASAGLPVSVANGGTGSTNASAARTALGLAIGTDVQAHDADLDTLASVGLPVPIAQGGTAATSASAARTALGLAIGTDVQAHDADLDTLAAAGLPISIANGGTGQTSAGAALTALGGYAASHVSTYSDTLLALTTQGAWQTALAIGTGGTTATISAPGGRLTLTSVTPVLTADVTAATTVYWTPYYGASYPSYDGSAWSMRTVAELSLALSATAHLSGKNYDLFLYNDGGVDRLLTGPAWTSDTARGTGAGTTELQLLNGFLTNKNSMTGTYSAGSTVTVGVNKGTYVGTFRASANGTTRMVMNPTAASGGALVSLLLFNYYNRVLVEGVSNDNGATYTYSSATVRQARASANNKIEFLSGLAEDAIEGSYSNRLVLAAVASASQIIGIALDSTTAFVESSLSSVGNTSQPNVRPVVPVKFAPQIGFHYIAALEASDGTNASTFGAGATDKTGFLRGLFRM
jgi:hypothetical protein